VRILAAFGAKGPHFFLGLADEVDALLALELGTILRSDVVLAVVLLEGDERNDLLLGIS
jgi:hypothetical protein